MKMKYHNKKPKTSKRKIIYNKEKYFVIIIEQSLTQLEK